MKKKLFPIFIIVVLILPIVSAQEFNLDLSRLTLILPLILTGFLVLFFLILYIKDHIKYLSNIFPKLKLAKKKKLLKQKKIINFSHELNLLQRRSRNLSPQDALKELSGLVKDFFKQKYRLENEFTYAELKITDQQIKDFIDDLTYLRYSNSEINKDKVNRLIAEFQYILKKTKFPVIKIKESIFEKLSKIKLPEFVFLNKIKEEYITTKINLFKQLTFKSKKVKEKPLKIKKLPPIKKEKIKLKIKLPKLTILRFLPKINPIKSINQKISEISNSIKIKNNLKQLKLLIKKTNESLNLNIHKAENLYSKALLYYYALPIKLQKKYSSKISDLYEKIGLKIEEEENKHLNELLKKTHNLKGSIIIDDKLKSLLENAIEKIKDHKIKTLMQKVEDLLNTDKKPTEKNTEHIKISKKLIQNLNKFEKRPMHNLVDTIKEDFKKLFLHLKKPSIKLNEEELKNRIKYDYKQKAVNELSKEEKGLFNRLIQEKEESKEVPITVETHLESKRLDELTKQEKKIFAKLKNL